MITEETIRKMAKLARIEIKKEKIEKYKENLNNIFKYMEMLQEVNTDNVKETNQVTGLFNVTQEDSIKEKETTREELLNCSPKEIELSQIKVQKTIN